MTGPKVSCGSRGKPIADAGIYLKLHIAECPPAIEEPNAGAAMAQIEPSLNFGLFPPQALDGAPTSRETRRKDRYFDVRYNRIRLSPNDFELLR